jgi:general secretion pathway protein G
VGIIAYRRSFNDGEYREVILMNKGKGRRFSLCIKGFTLIELMVVMLILSLIAAFALPRMFGKVGKAKRQAAYAQIELFGTALDSYRLDVGQYPTTSEGLDALITSPSGIEEWEGPYLKKSEIPLDPWNNPYHYESPGTNGEYDLYSYGKDNAAGGEGENKDIVSWKGLD